MELHIDASLAPGLQHLELIGVEGRPANLAGLPVVHVDDAPIVTRETARGATPLPVSQQCSFTLDVTGVDHVVVATDDVRATCAEIALRSGAALKRVKEGERGVQGFHRFGSVILEVVERRLVDPSSRQADHDHHAAHATYWGFVVTVADLDAAIAHLGPDVIGAAKPAVQPGRRIATVRSGAGLGVPLALMSR
ncbi:MAG: hypothetical protein ACKOE7_07885 [Actinomycetota bacterium]